MPKLADDDPRKWEYTEHTRAKHEILGALSRRLVSILGSSRAPRLVILDGFAGRAEYTGGESGSPVLIYEAAVRAVGRGVAQQITILCSEANPSNYASLKVVTDQLAPCAGRRAPDAAAGVRFRRDAASREWLAERRGTIPTFVFVDPFGFTGVPLEVIKALMSVDHVEVLLTFMARDMSRFLTLDTVEEALNEFFGGDAWRACVTRTRRTDRMPAAPLPGGRPAGNRALRDAIPCLRGRAQTPLYYLVHLTNHPLGMRRMKEAMIAQSADMTFWPITVRPKDQLALDISEGEP